jgi:hypothetical protein
MYTGAASDSMADSLVSRQSGPVIPTAHSSAAESWEDADAL